MARSLAPRLSDIIEAIGRIRTETAGVTLDAFEADWRKRWLVERGVEIVSEASRHLTEELKARHPNIPWPKVAGIGNVVRHNYERVAVDVLWNVARHDLPPLEIVCAAELAAERAREQSAVGEVRRAGNDDLPAIRRIVESAYAPYVQRMGRKPAPMLDDYAALVRDGRVHVFDDNGTIRGILVLIPEAGSMLLDNVAVGPGAQGLGYGRKLLEFAERSALDAGYDSIRLYTHETMTENIEMYSRIGFFETHRAEEKGLRRVYMKKRLA